MTDSSPIAVAIDQPNLTEQQFREWYARSIRDPKNFWCEQADKFVTWFKRCDSVFSGEFAKQNTQWFTNGKLNACYNCVDRHLEKRANEIAFFWEPDDPNQSATQFTFAELHEQVCQFANVLKKLQIKKGDRVCIYLPMIPEAIVSMLACARIGAVHAVVFGGFSADALKDRIENLKCKLVITADEGLRGKKVIPLKENVDKALEKNPHVKHVIVVQHTKNKVNWHEKRDLWYHEEIEPAKKCCPCEMMDANDPLFILYTSGSTGKPKGIVHTTGGYLVYVAMTFKYVFNYQEKDIYWCTADVGWITGHSYGVYGPLCVGATCLVYEGIPNYPTPARIWEIVDKYQVTILYTAPTAIRALRKEGDEWVKQTERSSLKLLGTVGEPINPDVWKWYFEVVGNSRCPVVDTWWQTETGGIAISPIPGTLPLKPGSASLPLFGIVAKIVDEHGNDVPAGTTGSLVLSEPWPGMMQTVYGDRDRFLNYFKPWPHYYLTGDNAKCDEEGYFWITGRNDDVIKVSGHRIGTEEVESAFLTHGSVSEAAVIGVPDDIKGEAIYAFVVLKNGVGPFQTF